MLMQKKAAHALPRQFVWSANLQAGISCKQIKLKSGSRAVALAALL